MISQFGKDNLDFKFLTIILYLTQSEAEVLYKEEIIIFFCVSYFAKYIKISLLMMLSLMVTTEILL